MKNEGCTNESIAKSCNVITAEVFKVGKAGNGLSAMSESVGCETMHVSGLCDTKAVMKHDATSFELFTGVVTSGVNEGDMASHKVFNGCETLAATKEVKFSSRLHVCFCRLGIGDRRRVTRADTIYPGSHGPTLRSFP